MRILLYVTSHMTHLHLECLGCWSAMLENTRVLRNADVRIFAASLHANHTYLGRHYSYSDYLEQWRAVARRLPNPKVVVSTALNPGYQEGAIIVRCGSGSLAAALRVLGSSHARRLPRGVCRSGQR